MKTILLTGFQPFVGRKANVSGDIARTLDGLRIGDVTVRATVMAVKWGTPAEVLKDRIARTESLLAVVGLGEGAGDRIKVEERARNGRRPGQKDEAGRTPGQIGLEIVPGGPDECTSPLAPVLLNALETSHIPCVASQNAGQFLCEETLYTALRLTEPQGGIAGFLHLPPYSQKDQDQTDPDNQAHLNSLAHAVKVALQGLVAWKGSLA